MNIYELASGERFEILKEKCQVQFSNNITHVVTHCLTHVAEVE